MEDRYLFHLRERCSWPRITRLRHKGLLSQLYRIASPANPDQYTLHFRVRLQFFERILLEKTLDQLDTDKPLSLQESRSENVVSDVDAESAAVVLFFRWSWADNVFRQALTELDPEWVEECHDGDFNSALDVFRSQLRTRVRSRNDLYDRRYYRTEQLMLDNPDLDKRGGIAVEEVTVVPHPADMMLWKKLGTYVLCNIEHLATWPGFRRELGEWLRLTKGKNFGYAMRGYVARLVEETPDFPPRGLFKGMNEDSWDGPDAEREGASDGEAAAEMASERDKERTEDWARITAQKIMEAEDLWDVWSFCRMLMVSVRNSQYRGEVEQFLASPEFARCWKISDHENGGGRVIVPKEPLSEVLSQRPVRFSHFYLLFQE